jgi:dipeptidyl aminopeptidase/acylaminoacyl peptidase
MRLWIAVVALAILAGCSNPSLTFEQALDDGPSYSAYLVSYRSDDLKVHAMVAVPKSTAPENGYPVVIANHGYVPDPRRYGITVDGVDSRPGDYYRSVPELYASRGFMVILPDYRGHNSSEGFEQIENQNRDSINLYANDVIELMSHLDEIEQADTGKVFMWSHSMGGGVSMHALLDTDIVKASSFWATIGVDHLSKRFESLDGPVSIQHSIDDKSVEQFNSERLAEALEKQGHPHKYLSYDSSDHYFTGEMRELAADRDVEFFKSSVMSTIVQ